MWRGHSCPRKVGTTYAVRSKQTLFVCVSRTLLTEPHQLRPPCYIGKNAFRSRSGSFIAEARGQRRARRSRRPPATLRVCLQHESLRTTPGCRRHHAGSAGEVVALPAQVRQCQSAGRVAVQGSEEPLPDEPPQEQVCAGTRTLSRRVNARQKRPGETRRQ